MRGDNHWTAARPFALKKEVLTHRGTSSYMDASRPPGDALARRRQSGTGTAPAAGVTQTPGSGGLRPIRGSRRIRDRPRLIRPPCTTTGPPKRLEADREKAGASDLCKGRK